MDDTGMVPEWPKISTVANWHEFSELAEKLAIGGPVVQPYFFRGQSSAAWSLQPSLVRHLRGNANVDDALRIESAAERKFVEQAHLFLSPSMLPDHRDFLGWWSLMQHHQVPTRLLDWTSSIYVAAYFAVMENWEEDGAVWVYHPHTVHKHMMETYGGDIQGITYPKLDELLRQETSAPQLFHFERRVKSDRMVAQQGATTVCGQILYDHAISIATALPEDPKIVVFNKIVIPDSQKPEFLRHLRSMNITANSLFPGIDGLGRSITELVNMEVTQLTT